MNKITIVFFLSCSSFCNTNHSRRNIPERIQTIIIQKIGKVDVNLLYRLKTRLEEFTNLNVLIKKNRPLPQFAYNSYRHRYKADSLLFYLKAQTTIADAKIIGITEHDIEIKLHNIASWGIMGLSYLQGDRCIVSIFRPGKTAFGKKHLVGRMFSLCMHELGHSYSVDHCEQANCIMQDPKGGIRLYYSDKFCNHCKEKLKVMGLLK